MLAIADMLRKQHSQPMVTFMTSAEEHTWLRNSGIPYYYLPSEARFRYTWSVNDDEIGEEIRKESAPDGLNDAIFKVLINHLAPSVVVFDTYFSPDKISVCVNFGAVPMAFFDNCDLLDVHMSEINAVRSQGGHLLFGINKCEKWPFDGVKKIHKVGRIVKHINSDRFELANSINKGRKFPHIICVQGGGGFRKENSTFYKRNPSFIHVIVNALESILNTGLRFTATIVLGPYGRWTDKIPQPKWAEILKFEPNLPSFLLKADMMISTGGYNAVSDSMAACCPSIFLPIREATENQESHVKWLVENGAAISVMHSQEEISLEVHKLLTNPSILNQMKLNLSRCERLSDGIQGSVKVIEDVLFKNSHCGGSNL